MLEALKCLVNFIGDNWELIIAIGNLLIAFSLFQFTRKDINPKLFVDSYQINKDDISDEMLERGIIYGEYAFKHRNIIDYDQQGFPEIDHKPVWWILEIVNNGDFPATHIELTYTIVIKKAEFEFGIDQADVINERFVDYKSLTETIVYDYLPPNGKRETAILKLYGDFPYATLKINNLKSAEMTFMKGDIAIYEYEHPEFEGLADSHHYRRVLGVYKPPK